MGIVKLITRIRRAIAYRLAKSKWEKLAIHHSFDSFLNKKVFLREVDLTLDKGDLLQLLKGYDHAKVIANYGGSFEKENKELLVHVDGVTIEIQTAEELFIIREIFVNRCYEFHLKWDCTLIDIGMNVGIAALYFASMPGVKRIYGFEPFGPTYKQAQANFARNPNLEDKIISQQIGWGDKGQSIEVEYSQSNRGRMGIHGSKLVKEKIDDKTVEKMEIKKANVLLEKVINSEKGKRVVVKMDCEGAEFDIIKNLKMNNLLGSIDILMMEWHINEPDSIINTLVDEGFRLFKMNYSSVVGMIYAVRS